LPELPPDEARRIGGEQEIIARYEPERAVETLPVLLADRKERARLMTLLDCVLADQRVQRIEPSGAQKAMLARIRGVLGRADHPLLTVRRGNGSRSNGKTGAPGNTDHAEDRAAGKRSRRKLPSHASSGEGVA